MADTTPPRAAAADRLALFLATGFGSGYAPVAPGTVGSAVATLLAWPLLLHLPLAAYLAVTALCFAIGVWASGRVEALLGSKDPGIIVIDEFAGVLVTFVLVSPTPVHLLLGLALFRVFDIAKPFPCRWAERHFTGGMGVMADDVIAGVYALICLYLTVDYLGP